MPKPRQPATPRPAPVGNARRTLVGELARDALARFPQADTRTLARMLHRDQPHIYRSVEHARQSLRHYRGAAGASRRRTGAHTIVATARRTPQQSEAARAAAGVAVPPSAARPWLPVGVPAGIRSIAVLADLHVPYHDVHAVTTAIDQAAARQPDLLLINGDLQDCHFLSKWEKDPRKRSFAHELATTADLWKYIRHKFPKSELWWKLGNHEEWYWRYLMRQAPALIGVKSFEPRRVFGLAATGVRIIDDQRIIHAGKLSIIHGHEYPAAVLSPVNAARGYFLRAKRSVLGSHYHQKSEHIEPDIRQRGIGAWSTGCLCDLHPEYARLNRWSHGWAHIELAKDGAFDVDNIRIY